MKQTRRDFLTTALKASTLSLQLGPWLRRVLAPEPAIEGVLPLLSQVDPEANGRREAGMAEMSRKFRAMGSEVYVDADKVKGANKALG